MPHRDEPPSTAEAGPPPQPLSFEEGLAQLADLVGRLEGGALGLSESIAAYERGVTILRGLHEELARAEERIRVLTAVGDDGRPVTAPLAGAPSGDESVEGRGAADDGDKVGRRPDSRAAAQRRTSRPQTLPGMDDPSGAG